jgi:hypothetical protein
MKKMIITAIAAIILVLISWHIYDTYLYVHRGKMLDADTKQPIEGMVVVALWTEESPSIAEGGRRFRDVKETLTDKNGEWSIRGPKGIEGGTNLKIAKRCVPLLTTCYVTHQPEFIFFKPGYCSSRGGWIPSCGKKGKSYVQAGELIIELTKLTNREDRLKQLPEPVHMVNTMSEEEVIRKQREFIKLLNEENKQIGYGELPYLKYLKGINNGK